MADQKYIKVDQEQTELLSQLVKQDNELLKELVDTYSKQEEKYLDGYRAFAYGLLQPLGIIAGFGFTAIGSVKTLPLFILGEAILIGSIVFAAFKTRQVYTSTLDSLAKEKDKKIAVIWQRIEYSLSLHEQALNEGKIPADAQEKRRALDQQLMTEFKPKEKDAKYYKFKDHLPLTFALTGVGIILVLLSLVAFRQSAHDQPRWQPGYHHGGNNL